jgi:hypothetical protein
MSLEGFKELVVSAEEKLTKQTLAILERAHVQNLNLHLIVLAVDGQGRMVTAATGSLPDPVTRARVLGQAAIRELEVLQQSLHQAAQAETVRLVQESTKTMVKQ